MDDEKRAPPSLNNTRDLREFLVAQMQAVADGQTDVTRAKAISNLAQQVYNTLSLEVRVAIARTKITGAVDAVSFTD